MAGDWIKWEKGLVAKPEVAQIARAVRISRHEAAARLMVVWEWADGATADGHIPGATVEDIDEVAGVVGFAATMARTIPHPWLEADSRGIRLINFGRHNGVTAKARALVGNRVKAYRERKHREV